MNHSDFLRERLGANWVLARRTSRILEKYGADVNCVSPKRYATVEQEYRALYGDPYDKTRAALYMALKTAVEIAPGEMLDTVWGSNAKAALEAERLAR